LNPPEYYTSGKIFEVNQQYTRTQGNAANDSVTQDTIDRAGKELNARVAADGGHF